MEQLCGIDFSLWGNQATTQRHFMTFLEVQKTHYGEKMWGQNHEKQLVPDRVLPRLIVLLFPYRFCLRFTKILPHWWRLQNVQRTCVSYHQTDILSFGFLRWKRRSRQFDFFLYQKFGYITWLHSWIFGCHCENCFVTFGEQIQHDQFYDWSYWNAQWGVFTKLMFVY